MQLAKGIELFVCSEHFTPDSYERSADMGNNNNNNNNNNNKTSDGRKHLLKLIFVHILAWETCDYIHHKMISKSRGRRRGRVFECWTASKI